MKTPRSITVLVGALAASLCLADTAPNKAPLTAMATKNTLNQINMPPTNPWVGDSVYPMSHYNSGQTDTTTVHGPEIGKKLTLEDAQFIPVSWVSAPTIKRIGDERFVIASNPLGIIKVRATGEAFDLIASVPYPHMEDVHAQVSDITLDRMRASIDKERASGSDGWLLAKAWYSYWKLNLGPSTMGSGAYQVIDHDGYHYTAYDKTWMVKSFDNNQPEDPMAPVKWVNMLELLPEQDTLHFDRILGITMTYDGHLVCAAGGGVFVLDRDLKLKSHIAFPGEAVENSIALDSNNAIYVVTSKNMHKLVWTGTRLSQDERDGAWTSPYNTQPEGESYKMGALSIGSGTTPTLMGFGDDEDKLVIISDADRKGANIVAFWRDEIPGDFKQKPGTLSRRIADQQPIKISHVTVEASPATYGYGVAMINSTYPEPSPIPMDALGNAFTAGVTRPAPMGVQKFIWNPVNNEFEEAWVLDNIDGSDWMPPLVSPKSGLLYLANKRNKTYEYVGADWLTGEIKATWEFPNDSVIWNNWGGIPTLLEDGDFLLGGFFGFKRYNVGHLK